MENEVGRNSIRTNEMLKKGKVGNNNDDGERDGNDDADVALFAFSLPWGTVSQLIPQALSTPS